MSRLIFFLQKGLVSQKKNGFAKEEHILKRGYNRDYGQERLLCVACSRVEMVSFGWSEVV